MLAAALFIAILALLVAAGFASRGQWAALRRYGHMGDAPDLDRARRIRGRIGGLLVVMALGLGGLIVAGELWPGVWRATAVGRLVLDGLVVAVGAGMVAAWVHAVRHQWSRRLPVKGMFVGMLWFVVLGALLALIIHWRWY